MEDKHQYSEISSTARVKSPDLIEHPVHLSPRVEIHSDSSIGKFTFINHDSIIYPHVSIGRYCSIARGCEIGAANHPTSFLSTHTFQYHGAYFPRYPEYKTMERINWRSHRETKIGHDVWIGAQVVIPAGVSIGNGAIIAANSVVTKDVPPYAIFGGCPAKLIRYRFQEETIRKLEAIKWWELDPPQLSNVPFDQIEKAILEIIQIKNR
ncbi:CatB-related O-acetyltransferase [Chromobacterium violaceum]|uniref:CatB-related O-acetyltransferase n=1 Tax=Chromobacterium violaceum TaxID=536 RepID=UPI0035A59674